MRITESYFVIESHKTVQLNPLTKKQADLKVRDIMGRLYLFSNNAKEIAQIDKIIRQLYGGQITPERAVIEAEEILEVKNSYTKLYRSFLNIFNLF